MCGINGYIKFNRESEEQLKADMNIMNDLIFHRGPDEDGVFNESNDSYSIAMAMRRLSIIDLSSGKQPIFSSDKNIVIVFNGEIYNYRELKSKLIEEGVSFSTTSDTEVILKLYEKHGVESFKELDGMFAFSIYDKNKNKLYITRDFFGEKPLYYFKDGNQLIWASELKSIIKIIDKKPEISKKGLNLYFRLTYIPAPYTIYDGIKKLEANHYIEYDIAKANISINKINPEETPEKKNISFGKATEDVKNLVYDSVMSRSISDVPLGTFLSGGVDSSVVSLCLSQGVDSKIDTFSIGFKNAGYDESDKSRLVAKLINSNHNEFIIDENDLKHNIHDIILNFDEPFADSSALPTFLVSQKTSTSVKVALTGDGGDEVFGGYNKHYMGKINNMYTSYIPQAIHKVFLKTSKSLLKTNRDNRGKRYKLKRILNSVDYNGAFYWDIISLGNTSNEVSEIIRPNWHIGNVFQEYQTLFGLEKPKTLNDFREIDRHISLEGDMLVKVDRTSMLNSLECRAPFLNKKLWDYTNTLPENYLIKGWDKKHILKEAFKDQFPEKFLDKSKSGFGVPVGDWLKTILKNELEGFIERKRLEKQGIFNTDSIIKLVKNHLSGSKDNTFKVWSFYCFQKWYYNTYINE
ncbi:asparagine synthase (glutamine-hydrolyzing) [Flavivirga spongiicola]|uniref:asparagine synthase (glutamine-hydrolyzing) n=1 Tax=Flavivirga spongiicola TaxID=421621 RepID=A0ABU7XY24_9FLAO|nr:asparagine synthase (glutamine-hydrolyzing) [Flavivirga sp. MEBiC05379]MDO5980477.1 asparagine synthase (glutamine-hydrolyzing) [Flavivirga sp. MEBiC05379]